MQDPQRDWKAWEDLGLSFYRSALKRPSEFPVRIRFAIQALRNAHEIADWESDSESLKRIQKELIYAEEMDGNFLFLNDTFSLSRVRALNLSGGWAAPLSPLWEPDLVTSIFAGPGKSFSSSDREVERIRLETENMMAALKVSYLMLYRFSDEFLGEYYREPASADIPAVSEMMYSAAPAFLAELLARLLYLVEKDDLETSLKRVDQFLSILLLLPSDRRGPHELQIATGSLLSSDPAYHRYEVGFRGVDLFMAWSLKLFQNVESRNMDLDRQDLRDRWAAIVRTSLTSDGEEIMESASQTRFYLLERLTQKK